jgi:hypothetical protein
MLRSLIWSATCWLTLFWSCLNSAYSCIIFFHYLFQIRFLRGALVKLPLSVSLIRSVLIGTLVQILGLVILVVSPGEIWVISPSWVVSIGIWVDLRPVIVVEYIHLLRIPLSGSTPITIYGQVIASTTIAQVGD